MKVAFGLICTIVFILLSILWLQFGGPNLAGFAIVFVLTVGIVGIILFLSSKAFDRFRYELGL